MKKNDVIVNGPSSSSTPLFTYRAYGLVEEQLSPFFKPINKIEILFYGGGLPNISFSDISGRWYNYLTVQNSASELVLIARDIDGTENEGCFLDATISINPVQVNDFIYEQRDILILMDHY